MESYERDPEGFRQRMESFKDEKGVLWKAWSSLLPS
jgi:hypothetical protein